MPLRPGRIGQRAKDVEDRPQADLLARSHRVPHRGMKFRREHEAQAVGLKDSLHRRGLEIHGDAEGFEEVGTAAMARDRPVPMLGDDHARRRDDEHGNRGHVERREGSASGAAEVDDAAVRWRTDCGASFPHRRGHARDLIGPLPLHPEPQEERADLGRGRLPVHDLRHRVVCAFVSERSPGRQVRDCLADHRRAPFRKFRRRSGPSGVRIDSGWNWTPSTGCFRCRTAMISPSSAVALTSRSRGKDARTIARE